MSFKFKYALFFKYYFKLSTSSTSKCLGVNDVKNWCQKDVLTPCTQVVLHPCPTQNFFFHLGFTACQDYFIHFEPSQSLGGAKMGNPREKPPDHQQAELGLSQRLGSDPQSHSSEMTSNSHRNTSRVYMQQLIFGSSWRTYQCIITKNITVKLTKTDKAITGQFLHRLSKHLQKISSEVANFKP